MTLRGGLPDGNYSIFGKHKASMRLAGSGEWGSHCDRAVVTYVTFSHGTVSRHPHGIGGTPNHSRRCRSLCALLRHVNLRRVCSRSGQVIMRLDTRLRIRVDVPRQSRRMEQQQQQGIVFAGAV